MYSILLVFGIIVAVSQQETVISLFYKARQYNDDNGIVSIAYICSSLILHAAFLFKKISKIPQWEREIFCSEMGTQIISKTI